MTSQKNILGYAQGRTAVLLGLFFIICLASGKLSGAEFISLTSYPVDQILNSPQNLFGLKILKQEELEIGTMALIEAPDFFQKEVLENFLPHSVIESNFEVTLDGIQRDPFFPMQWPWQNTGQPVPDESQLPRGPKGKEGVDLGMEDVWEHTLGSENVLVAIIDTGINFQHPELTQASEQFFTPPSITDGHGHGTHVAGTIAAAHDNMGVMGAAPHVKLVDLRAFNSEGKSSSYEIISALNQALKLKVQVINASFGGHEKSEIQREIISKLNKENIILVAAAGNDSLFMDHSPHYPAAFTHDFPNVISVASHGPRGNLSKFSNQSEKFVDLAAPGEAIISTFLGNDYQVWSGTSMATPHVSAAIALKLSLYPQTNAQTIKRELLESVITSPNLWNKVRSHGRLNIAQFLKLKEYPSYPAPDLNEWKVYKLQKDFSTPHPYGAYTMVKRAFKIPGAKYIRAKFSKMETEDGLDKIFIRDPIANKTMEVLTGNGQELLSTALEGEEIEIEFISDDSRHFYGFEIKELLYL